MNGEKRCQSLGPRANDFDVRNPGHMSEKHRTRGSDPNEGEVGTGDFGHECQKRAGIALEVDRRSRFRTLSRM